MAATSPKTTQATNDRLLALGEQIRAQRKALRISAVVVAESAGMSRITLHRIERGEPSVTMGAYLNAMMTLGLSLSIHRQTDTPSATLLQDAPGWIPARIPLAHYPQLKQLAWQVHGTEALTPTEALSIYERNWRHVDSSTVAPHEQHLIDALRLAFGEAPHER